MYCKIIYSVLCFRSCQLFHRCFLYSSPMRKNYFLGCVRFLTAVPLVATEEQKYHTTRFPLYSPLLVITQNAIRCRMSHVQKTTSPVKQCCARLPRRCSCCILTAFPFVSLQVQPEKLKTLTQDLEALDRAAKRGLK